MQLLNWLDITVPEWTNPQKREEVNEILRILGPRRFIFVHRNGHETGIIQISNASVNYRFPINRRITTVEQYYATKWDWQIQ
ncbi:unnamed protein product [Caenorhabditis nigoni]